ncbi:hypothetical protein [Andreprevotia lacus]|uniref:hypothetical protein n=1 Tax=Andreprevotia lacus TaxID=1121000 RepID=UPI00111C6282|nr:hypothetical protein [Andreprevotia lacus]
MNSDDMSSSVKAYLLNKTGMSYLETAANTNPFSALVTSYDGAQAMDSALTVGKIALSFLNPGLSALVTGLDIAQDAVNGKLGWNTLGKVASVVPGNGLVNGIAKTGLTIGGQLGSGDTQGASGTVGNFTGSLLGSLTGTPLGGPIGGWVGTQIGRGIADGGSDGSASSGGNRGGYGSGNGALVVNTPARPATSATSATTVPNSVTAYQLASASNFMG